jgi:hypothetical protein
MQCQIALPPNWVGASRLETAIRACGHPHGPGVYEVVIQFPIGCKVMIDAAIRLLSLADQLAFTTCRVRLDFEEEVRVVRWTTSIAWDSLTILPRL